MRLLNRARLCSLLTMAWGYFPDEAVQGVPNEIVALGPVPSVTNTVFLAVEHMMAVFLSCVLALDMIGVGRYHKKAEAESFLEICSVNTSSIEVELV